MSFSLDNYQNPNHVNWGPLRALNEDLLALGRGFGPHDHRESETHTYPSQGATRHTNDLWGDCIFEIAEPSFTDRWQPIASPARDGSVSAHQQALIYASRLSPGVRMPYRQHPEQFGYLHIVDGSLLAYKELQLHAGDGLRFDHGQRLCTSASPSDVQVLFFDH